MRIFISINLPEEIKEEISKIQEEFFKTNLFKGKTVSLENIHLTLKFLGEIDSQTLEEVRSRLREIRFDSFDAEIDFTGVFDKENSKIIWLHLKGAEKLQKAIDLELVDLFNMEKRFMSHITIIRVRNVNDEQKLLETVEKNKSQSLKFKVNSFCLMESRLSKEGANYNVLEEYPSNG
jgi:2'-5' RNA ligase